MNSEIAEIIGYNEGFSAGYNKSQRDIIVPIILMELISFFIGIIIGIMVKL